MEESISKLDKFLFASNLSNPTSLITSCVITVPSLFADSPLLWLQSGGRPSEHQLEHRSTDLPDPGFAGERLKRV